MVAAWASRFLPPLAADLPQVEGGKGVVASETLAGKFQLTVRSGEHTLFADGRNRSEVLDGLSPTNWCQPGWLPAR